MLPTLQAQTYLSGTLKNQLTQENVPFAVVQILETEQWTTTDENGNFKFNSIIPDEFTIKIQSLGYQEFQQKYTAQKSIIIELLPQTYDVKEIIVTAEQGQGMSTSSKINNAAMDHVQPTTLGDVMQLLPGGLIENPDLSSKQTISIREIGTDNNSADGTAIIIDGSPIDNDANLQNENLSGIDLRQISTDNIESIEVIKGIPSVTYGNLTSGAIIVKTKTGYTPYEAKVKTDPGLKQVSVAKGFLMENGSAFNTNIDYLRSFHDPRSKYEGFNRITAQVGYSKTFMEEKSPLYFDAKLAFHNTLDQEKTDPDAMRPEEILKSSETGVRLNISGKWALNKLAISNIVYNLRASVKGQEDYEKRYRSGSLNRISYATEAGENQGIYLASESLTELTIKGLPTSVYAQVYANKNINTDFGLINNTLLGTDYRLNGNYGDGRIYDIMNPSVVSYSSSRPRPFKDIPASETFALFAENKTNIPIYNTTLDVMLGVRLNNFQPNNFFKSDVGVYWEPRFNLRYRIINNNERLLKKLSLYGGIGLNYKAPSLHYLYPDPAYFDILVMDYYPENSEYAQVWFNTHIIEDTSNPNLKPSKNLKKEVGLNLKIGKVSADITLFDEELSNGFGMLNNYHFTHNTYYNTSGVAPNTAVDKNTLPTSDYTYILSHDLPVNNKATRKQGLEYNFDFGTIKAISTKISMNGAWLRTKRIYSTMDYARLPSKTVGSGQYDEIAVYPAGEGKISERMNTTFRLVTHIPKVSLIFTTSLQVTWIDKYHYTYYDESPLYLYKEDGTNIPFTAEMRKQAPYSYDYVENVGENYYIEESLPPLFLCNFKLSKDIAEHFRLSFYANNFINYRPVYQFKRSNSFTRLNPSIYFGAELRYKF